MALVWLVGGRKFIALRNLNPAKTDAERSAQFHRDWNHLSRNPILDLSNVQDESFYCMLFVPFSFVIASFANVTASLVGRA